MNILKVVIQILKVATNESVHITMCTWIALEIYNNKDQNLTDLFYLKIRITTFNVDVSIIIYSLFVFSLFVHYSLTL